MISAQLIEFTESLRIYAAVSAKRHGEVWLCSLRSSMGMGREEFSALAIAAHQADLIELSRADLVDTEDPRYVTESEIEYRGARFHFVRL